MCIFFLNIVKLTYWISKALEPIIFHVCRQKQGKSNMIFAKQQVFTMEIFMSKHYVKQSLKIGMFAVKTFAEILRENNNNNKKSRAKPLFYFVNFEIKQKSHIWIDTKTNCWYILYCIAVVFILIKCLLNILNGRKQYYHILCSI